MSSTRGFTYLEVLLAVVILAGAAISASGALIAMRDRDEQEALSATAAHLLADGVARAYRLLRVDNSAPVFGPEASDTVSDDIDDLDGLIETGPVDLGGDTHASSWQRGWRVTSANLSITDQEEAPGSTPLMRVRISIRRSGAELAATTILLARTP